MADQQDKPQETPVKEDQLWSAMAYVLMPKYREWLARQGRA